ncbi:hypothetical protein BH11BAC5_BH11BAC5_20280 [soil metagenome]
MKKLYLVTLLILQLALATTTNAQNVGINATSSLPDNSAMLDVSSIDKGFLAPRLTTTQQNAISLPATGLLIFNTTDNLFKVNTGTPAVPLWTPLAMGSGVAISSLNGLTGTTQTLATGTLGTDFGITSSGTAHTFNIPTASAINRGALSASDWSIFNGKLGLTSLSATTPLSYNNTTGAFSIAQANTTGNGYLSSADWNIFNNKQGALSGTANRITIASNIVDISSAYVGQNSITTLGTVGTGIWQGTAVGATYGGTGQSSVTTGDLLYGSATNTWSKLPAGTNGQVLTLASGMPTWAANPGSTAWNLTGNTVTAGSQFLGSTNNVSLRMKTNNVERMVVDSVGNVGIGTNNPDYSLPINKSINGSNGINIVNSSAGTGAGAAAVLLLKNNAGAAGEVFKTNTGYGTYKTITTGDMALYNTGAGNITMLNDYASGKLLFAAGGSTSAQMTLSATGNLGIGQAPTATLHLKAGTASANTAPLKLTSGINLTTPEDGAVEYNGSHFYGTIGTTRYQLDQQVAGSAWSLTGNTPTAGSHFLGSTNNVSLRLRTNNTERMIIDSTGKVGVGLSDPAAGYYLSVKDNLEIRRTATTAQMIFTNTAGSGNFRIGGDGGDIYWQGGGGQSLQMGSYWATVLGGDRQTAAFPAFIGGISGTSVIIASQRDASVALAVQANSGSQTANLTEWRNSAGTTLSAVDVSGNMGVGTSTPNSPLQVNGAVATAVASISANATLSAANSLVLVTTGNGSDKTITLPDASSCTGRVYSIKKIDSGSKKVIVDGNGSQTIDGATTYTLLSSKWKYLMIQSDGSNWMIISNN